jgi:hypothetical protein
MSNANTEYLTPQECVERGYAAFPADAARSLLVPRETAKIYESPDRGKTVFEREFGSDPLTRKVIKTSVQQQWTITFNGKPVDL